MRTDLDNYRIQALGLDRIENRVDFRLEARLVDSSYPVKEWYEAPNREDYMVKVGTDSRWWLQPGNPEVQQLIINGAALPPG